MRSPTGLTPVFCKRHTEGSRPQSRSHTYRVERDSPLGVGQSDVLRPRCDRERGRISSRVSGVGPHLFRLTSSDNQLSKHFGRARLADVSNRTRGVGLAYLPPFELGLKPQSFVF